MADTRTPLTLLQLRLIDAVSELEGVRDTLIREYACLGADDASTAVSAASKCLQTLNEEAER